MAESSTIRWPLSIRILGLALLNLVLAAAVVVGFAQWLFGFSFESIALGPARERIIEAAHEIRDRLDEAPRRIGAASSRRLQKRIKLNCRLSVFVDKSLGDVPVELPAVLLPIIRPSGRKGGPMDGRKGDVGRPEGGQPVLGPMGEPRLEKAFFAVTHSPLSYWIGVRIPVKRPDGERGFPAVLLFRSNSLFNRTLFFEWRWLLCLTLALAAVALLCWWPFVHGVTKSIRQMEHATQEIAIGHFSGHVSLRRTDELGHLWRHKSIAWRCSFKASLSIRIMRTHRPRPVCLGHPGTEAGRSAGTASVGAAR